ARASRGARRAPRRSCPSCRTRPCLRAPFAGWSSGGASHCGSLSQERLHAGQRPPRRLHLHGIRKLRRGPAQAQVEELLGELALGGAQLVDAELAQGLQLAQLHDAAACCCTACRSRSCVGTDSFAAASASAFLASARSTPSISKIMRPGFTTATQTSGAPFP